MVYIYMLFIFHRNEMRECIFSKGQSKRLWNELYKVSEIVVLVNTSLS